MEEASKEDPMDNKNLEFFKQIFFDLKKNWNSENLEAPELLTTVEGGDEVDCALTERDRELTLKIAGRSRFFHKKIDDALTRIDGGTFGCCEECGEDIELSRLKARPMTNMCIHCKEEEERAEQSIPYGRRSHTLGKAIVGGNALTDFDIQNRPSLKLLHSEISN